MNICKYNFLQIIGKQFLFCEDGNEIINQQNTAQICADL